MKKEEINDIVQYLIPKLEKLGISKENCKIDVSTEKSGNKRGDIWISLKKQTEKDFEKNIIALIEAKHRNSIIGDIDWRDAMRQGKEKSLKQGLNYYIITNCKSDVRFYNSSNDEEIEVDEKPLIKLVSIDILQKIQSQISEYNSQVVDKIKREIIAVSEAKFRATLKNLANIYRSAGLKKGNERIDPTISFVVLKYISEKETEKRTLNKVIKLWNDFKPIVDGKEIRDLKAEFEQSIKLIWGDDSSYKDNEYKDFKNLLKDFSIGLKNEHLKKIYKELDQYHFHGANFDLYGTIYEEFASQTKKKEFGEFYTRRHITGMVARLLLRNETNPRELKICDPACGTGGFLTEAYRVLENNYLSNNKLNQSVKDALQEKVLWGYDNDKKSVARTKLNMFLAGDGHIHIYANDSLLEWNEDIDWKENEFDYIITNPPMGQYKGEARIEDFDFTNEKRYELIFIEKIIKATKYGEEIAIVINDGTLETPSRENFRKKLLEYCNIYAILSLTKFAFAPYTKEKTYILFMQKKQEDKIGEIQKFPIWHFILDYDGYANSDKRYVTKYHNDIPELEEKFDGAISLARIYLTNKNKFNQEKINFEREINNREKEEGLWGMKYEYVYMEDINEENFYNLLSEFQLRPYQIKKITKKEFENKLNNILQEFKEILADY